MTDLEILLATIDKLGINYKLVKSDHGYFDPKTLTVYYTSETLKHELIHLLDYASNKLEMNNCDQVLCSEIRANALSGDCDFIKEVLRGHIPDFKECVRRRSLWSGKQLGCFEIGKVFEKCIKDKFPFE